jgi:hypothetical protein
VKPATEAVFFGFHKRRRVFAVLICHPKSFSRTIDSFVGNNDLTKRLVLELTETGIIIDIDPYRNGIVPKFLPNSSFAAHGIFCPRPLDVEPLAKT